MKNVSISLIILLIVFAVSTNGQDLSIGSSTTLSLGSAILSLSGNWDNSGTFNAESGTVIFNNASGNQTISNSSGETFYNLIIDKTADDVRLANDLTVSGTLTCTSGDLDLNGNVLTLTGTLSETDGNTVKGTSGYITCSSDLNAPSDANPHGIGIEITSASNLGTTTIVRGHEAQTGASNTGMKRYFEITPSNNTSLNATIAYNYDDSELNSLDESTFEMFSSEDNGSTWCECTGTLDATNNTYTVSGINSFSRFTLASSSSPLPVELTTFAASVEDNNVLLKWETATEINNYGFEVERKNPPLNPLPGGEVMGWEVLGFVPGHGNSSSPKSYDFVDDNAPVGNLEYRLKQIDTDGKYTYYVMTAEINNTVTDLASESAMPTEFSLSQNYPNPFNPTTTIKYSIPTVETLHATSLRIKLVVYDMLGCEVATLVNGYRNPGNYTVEFDGSELTSGIYFYRIDAGKYKGLRKMLLVK